MYVCMYVCLYIDSDSEMMSLDTDSCTDETLLTSIDKLSDACVMRFEVSLVRTGSLNLGQCT